MGQRGPLKGSRRLAVVKGGKNETPDKEPKAPTAKRFQIPKSLPPEARKFLKKVIPELEETFKDLGGLKEGDIAGLSAMAMHWAVMMAACAMMTEGEGKTAKLNIVTGDPDHKSDDGPAVRKHPLLSVLANHSEKLNAWSKEFGLTPAARERLGIKPPKGASKLAQFIGGKKY